MIELEPKYLREDLEVILSPISAACRDYRIKLEADGLITDTDTAYDSASWTPAQVLPPSAKPTPANQLLPIPFTARQFAAVFLNAIGFDLREHYGAIATGPRQTSLSSFPVARAKTAVEEAYRLLRQAEATLLELPEFGAARRQIEKLQANLKRVKEMKTGRTRRSHARRARLRRIEHAIQLEYENALYSLQASTEWRRAVVHHLLKEESASPPIRRSRASPLSLEQQREVTRRRAAGETQAALAREFGVSRPTIKKYESAPAKPAPVSSVFEMGKQRTAKR